MTFNHQGTWLAGNTSPQCSSLPPQRLAASAHLPGSYQPSGAAACWIGRPRKRYKICEQFSRRKHNPSEPLHREWRRQPFEDKPTTRRSSDVSQVFPQIEPDKPDIWKLHNIPGHRYCNHTSPPLVHAWSMALIWGNMSQHHNGSFRHIFCIPPRRLGRLDAEVCRRRAP